MRSTPAKRDGELEPQHSGLHPGYCDYENTNPVLMAQYSDTFHNLYISAVAANDGNYSIFLPSNIWPAETAAAPDTPVADPFSSPTIPTHYMAVPMPGPFIGGDVPMTSNEEQSQTDSMVYTTPRTPWWLASPNSAGSSDNLMTPATSFEVTISNSQDSKTANMTFAHRATNLGQVETPPGLRHECSPRRTSMFHASESSEAAADFESSASRPAVISTRDIDSLQGPKAPVSKAGLLTPGVNGHTSPRRPASLKRANPSNDGQQTPQSPPPKARPEKRSRNRAAAHKCRAKSKASVAALKASERTQSQRREQLLETFRALQAGVLALKSEILQHAHCGDRLIDEYLDSAARSFAPGSAGGATEFAPGDGWWIPDWTNVLSPS